MPSNIDPQKYNRRSFRMKGYDYTSAGGYFITIVTYQRECLFGEIVNREMRLSNYGKIADGCWRAIPDHFPNVQLGAYVVMPNHVNGIVTINDGADANASARSTIYRAPTDTIEQFSKPTTGSAPTIIRTFKAAVTRRIGRELNSSNIWQRNFYERIIRNDAEHNRIYLYIQFNASRWEEVEENPAVI